MLLVFITRRLPLGSRAPNLRKASVSSRDVCDTGSPCRSLALQKIEDAANEILQRAGGDDELAWSMRGNPPFYAQLAGSRMRIG
jgi:hypothetical protein